MRYSSFLNSKLNISLATVLLASLLSVGLQGPPARAAEGSILLASTTSTDNSGLLDFLLPLFKAETGIDVRTVVRGTGQAIRLAEKGDADVLMVHHRPSEERFVAEGYGVERHELMYNDFVLIGPVEDPAAVKGEAGIAQALAKIAGSQAPFVSRGDDSGTHKRELELWGSAGLDPRAASGGWYREMGAGMGATLNGASAMGAYVLCDRSTWLAFKNRKGLEILYEGTPPLFNQYSVILVNPERHPFVKSAEGQAFIDWLLSEAGQNAISTFRIEGQQVFFPNGG